MNKNAFFLFLIPLVIFLESCKKDNSSDTSTTTNYILSATIGGTSWVPDTVSASITYNSSTKTKVFAFTGTKDQKRVNAIVNDSNPVNNGNFTGGSYSVSAAGNLAFTFSTQIKNSEGNYVFEPFGTVQPGSGTLNVASIDTVAKTITGTYSFTSSKSNYDANGNLISIDLAAITAGTFTNLPYTYKRE